MAGSALESAQMYTYDLASEMCDTDQSNELKKMSSLFNQLDLPMSSLYHATMKNVSLSTMHPASPILSGFVRLVSISKCGVES